MKTKINRKASLVFLAIASMSISSFASGDINISPKKESLRAIVEIDVPVREDVNVTVTDPGGTVIHSDVISKNSEYGKVFDFSQVNDGVYTFVTKTEHTTVSKTIELEGNKLSVINKEYAHKPVFKIEGDLITVNFLNQTNESISISIEDSAKDYFKEEGDNSALYGKMVSVRNLPAGKYKVVLAVGEKVYNYNFIR